jgi:hypothetical protein
MAVRRIPGTGVLNALWGALQVLWALLNPWFRSWRTRWGATPSEVAGALPGDDLVPAPCWSYTHAITIQAPAATVFPWLKQIGARRGGFYTYQGLENLAGCRITNTARILDLFQDPRVGDPIHLHPEMPPLRVVAIEPDRTLVLFGEPAGEGAGITATWQFVLVPLGERTTRLLARGRYDHDGRLSSRLSGGPTLVEPMSFVMERKMLRSIRALAEAAREAEAEGSAATP